ncbi:MAG: hypothetical protein WDW38_000299 [Sanguina aurantia]
MSAFISVAAGFAFSYFNSKLQEERKARIDRVNDQLKNFYGPLLSCVCSTKSAYEAMIYQHSKDGSYTDFQNCLTEEPSGQEASAYRLWTEEVLQPLNEKAASIIMDHIDLLDTPTLEPCLLQLVAHVCALRVTLSRWRKGDMTAFSVIPYPDAISEYVRGEFGRMKQRQASLLNTPIDSSITMRSKL